MKILAYKEDTGKFNGWYDDQIHQTIPSPNLEVSDKDYFSYYENMVSGKELIVVDGKVTFQDMTPPVPTWEEIRNERNRLLTASDYTQMPDNELTTEKQQAWKLYRSALRKIPETYTDPADVVWPTPPE